ncbi:MAG: hypothetical protein ACQEQV_08410 [Fibrobacterota bacterium]
MKQAPVILTLIFFFSGCMRYMTHERTEAIVENIDIGQTLRITEYELKDKDRGNSLGLWVIKDQFFTPTEAERVQNLYFRSKENIVTDFDAWHFTWAVSNIYRLGNAEVRRSLDSAHSDARRWADTLGRRERRMTRGDTLYMGDAHIGGRYYARNHIIAPGNPDYLQSWEDFLQEQE